MRDVKGKIWLIGWFAVVVPVLCILGSWVYGVDPFFHYHGPDLEKYFYTLDNQRSQNDGISRHFEYDALISGSSMTENFRTSEADEIFGFRSIKVPYSGGTYKEVNDNVKRALEANPELKTVIRCLEMGKFIDETDALRTDLGEYPSYLYDNDPFNDVEYLLNRDVIFGRVYPMTVAREEADFQPGITSFDEYSRWQEDFSFGIRSVSPSGIVTVEAEEYVHLTDHDREVIRENIEKNVTDVADEYPEVEFYYFYSPYSAVTWNYWKKIGTLYKMLEAEEYITELIVPYENIRLFSFNTRTDITTDLNNYKDADHYACWINSLILRWMHDGSYRLTPENYRESLQRERDFYTAFDCGSLNGQTDYEADLYAAALLNQELTGAAPKDIVHDAGTGAALSKAEYFDDEDGRRGVVCRGTLERESDGEALEEYLWDREYAGLRFTADLDGGYRYLSFEGQKISDHGRLTVCIYDRYGNLIGKTEKNYTELDGEKHRYVVDLSAVRGTVTVILHGGYIDDTGSADSEYRFTDIKLY